MVSPGPLVISNCVCDTPLPLGSALLSQVYLGSAKRRERNPPGRGDWAQERGCFFFSFLWLCFSGVMDSSPRGSRRSGQRHPSSDLVRNVAALLYLFFFSQLTFVSFNCVCLQCECATRASL